MSIIVLQVFVSLLLVAGGVLLLAYSVKQADYEHADRVSLFPLDDDDGVVATAQNNQNKREG